MNRKELENYICETYNVNSEFPWLKFPSYAVFRHNANKKWFALVMNVSKKKLGLSENSEIEILNVKCDPLMIESFKMEAGIYPGYHMNKKFWISVALDGSVDYEKIKTLINISFKLTE